MEADEVLMETIQELRADNNRLLDVVGDALVDLTIATPAMARLALLYHEARPNELGKENCTCGERDTCDECPTLADELAFLRRLAARK